MKANSFYVNQNFKMAEFPISRNLGFKKYLHQSFY